MASNLKISELENQKDEVIQLEAGQVENPSATTELETPNPSTTKLPRRRLSMMDVDIQTALGNQPELIGDLSKPGVLPCLLKGTRHADLKTISSDILSCLIKGKFAKQLGIGGGYQIIDCRYPYEFDGGHILGAKNLYTTDQILKSFPFPSLNMKEPKVEEGGVEAPAPPRRIYVFHCEFSSERAPKLMRFLRNHDRRQNVDNYPQLDYPEVYLLHQGYRAFYDTYINLCEPRRYVPMLSPAHKDDYRLCRLQIALSRQQQRTDMSLRVMSFPDVDI